MRKIGLIAAVLSAGLMLMAGGELKVLTIGNSFADSVFRDLPQAVESVPGCKLKLDRANIGGCSLLRHWEEIGKCEANANYKPYGGKYTLKEKLESDKWDIVTLHQVSNQSFEINSFEPYLGNLVAYVHQYAPQAEIVLQMTWAYRDDHVFFDNGKLDPAKMFDGIFKAYGFYGKKYQFRVIPVGKAVELALATQSPKFVKPAKRPDITGLKYPENPNTTPGSFYVEVYWGKNKEGNFTQSYDLKHLNARGSYLQACVWFAFLFDEDPRKITYIPQGVTPEDAAFLRDVAAKAFAGYKQPRGQ